MSDLSQQALNDLHTANRLLNALSERYPLNCDAQANELAGVLSRAITCLVSDKDRVAVPDQQLRDLQAIIGRQEEELDALREQVETLQDVADAAWLIVKGRCTTFGYHFGGETGDGRALDRALSQARRR